MREPLVAGILLGARRRRREHEPHNRRYSSGGPVDYAPTPWANDAHYVRAEPGCRCLQGKSASNRYPALPVFLRGIIRTVASPLTCPVCGYAPLTAPPYANYSGTVPAGAAPPYEEVLGKASYEVCPRCDFEFGNDDNPGTAAPTTFEEYRREWEARSG